MEKSLKIFRNEAILSGKIKSNNLPNWTNKKHTEETKELMNLSKRGKFTGTNSSQYNTCWIRKGDLSKKIKKDDLDKYLLLGWIKGRKNKY